MRLSTILEEKKSTPHDSAHLHVAGESKYVDDMALSFKELVVGLVYSPHAKAKIISIDDHAAKNLKGVSCIITAKDVKHNLWGSIFHEQPLIASEQVNYVGEVVAVVGAKSKKILDQALKLIKINYELMEPILNINSAIAKKSFIGQEQTISCGDAINQIKKAPFKLSGELNLHGADHFYLENQAALAIPDEGDEITIHSSTQHPTETQHVVASALGLAQSSVHCIAKRLGGGFGGKETQASPIAAFAALVAFHTKNPARLVLSKDDDMIITGKRNPYHIKYEVGFDECGLIKGLSCQMFGDGGAYADLSSSILERAMAHVDNAYYLEHALIKGIVCRTNYHPHTAFRGFGGPKGVALIEHIMEEIAYELGIDSLDVRKSNCYREDKNITPYGQRVKNNCLPKLFDHIEESSNYRERKKQIELHNQTKKNHPRGISVSAIKFGISFTTRFLNQASALIHIHRDGSIQVSTGAVEMGQGVQARIRNLVANAFGVEEKRITILATSTNKNANTSPTAASSGTDLNGSAALNACDKIKFRLAKLLNTLIEKPYDSWPQNTAAKASCDEVELDQIPLDQKIIFANSKVYFANKPAQKVDFKTLIEAAYLSRVSLSDMGFYKVPNLSFNKLTSKGDAFLYFTQGVACSEVEIDRYSGELKVQRCDIVMDLGRPINDALDRGQVSGGFIQGLGWVTSESLFYDKGMLQTHSPSTYKIPSVHDIPRQFNISLIENNENYANLHGTKAVGEPPLMLCFSVWNAIKHGLSQYTFSPRLVNLNVPASGEDILKVINLMK